jgi:hypothetical protein
VISCSNDTTIKIWNVTGINEKASISAAGSGIAKNISAKGTLNEDYDYVRCIAYS